jgi:2-keto-4-pentenoate hydratase/2-oxohepta-3-ene-1,7-dioic acid hydratase in catechol pathway
VKICRFNDSRIGVVEGDVIRDVTELVRAKVQPAWPPAHEDVLVARLPEVRSLIEGAAPNAVTIPLASAHLLSPVAWAPKIVAAPVNYKKHVEESVADAGIHYGSAVKTIETAGLFLKSPTSLVGASSGVTLRFPDRRNDHEVELAVIIGRRAERVTRGAALDYVAGYAIGLDMTVRGPEDRSFRKSPDSYTVLGPWMVTADEFGDPSDVSLKLSVNGEVRQDAHTRDLLIDVPSLIAWASDWYALHPGDVLITGTPEGVGPVVAGDVIYAEIERIGAMSVNVR